MRAGSSLRDAVAKSAVKTVNLLSRWTARGSGTVIGGRVGLALAPDLLASLSRGREIILVSGTNGKTTTTAMIAAGWARSVVTNATGSNMPAGHVAALVSSDDPAVVLEVDEAWLGEVTRSTNARVVTLLNLSRDQLDRANEVRRIAERWRALLTSAPSVTVVANANDPLVVFAAEAAAHVVWCDVPTPWTTDAVSCPYCTGPLHFVGESWWSECGFAKPTTVTTSLRRELTIRGVKVDLDISMPGEFNRSNAAMALTALGQLGVDLAVAATHVNALTSVAGRFSERCWRGHRLRLLLAKNPAGFAAMLSALEIDGADLWVAINARVADGHDPSWLYDVPFEALRGRRVYCFGERRLDIATRLDYAGVDHVVVDDDTTLPNATSTISVLANYTAFQDWRERTSAC
jgi:UDP-N-acetylmuramyl tripeptide synthase